MKNSILFDLDGTLWDTTIEVEKVWNKIAMEYRLNISKEQIKNIMGLTKREIIEYLFKGNNKDGNEFITKCQEKENDYLKENGGHIYKKTIKTIKKLVNKYDLYIVSNCQAGYIESFIEHYSLQEFFKDFECSGNTGMTKYENINSILKRNNILKAIYVGDTQKDYESAIKNELPFILAEYGFGNCDRYYKKIKDISELLNIEI